MGDRDRPVGGGLVRAGDLDEVGPATSTLLHPTTDGSVVAGSSRQPAISPEAEDAGIPATIVRGAIDLVPTSRTPRCVRRGGGSGR